MLTISPEEQTFEQWRPGVLTRLRAAASTGTTRLCVIEQWCEPGTGAPTHTHFDVEEVLIVADGKAEFWVGGDRRVVESPGAVIVPPHSDHGFKNVGESTLHILAVFSAAAPPAEYREEPGSILEVGARRDRMKDAHRAIRMSSSALHD